MQTSSSANLTWRESLSASEWTATVLIPSSRQAQMILRAISPRLAIRIFLNISGGRDPDSEQHLPVLHRLAIADGDVDHLSGDLRLDLVHQLHGLDDAQDLSLLHDVAHLDEGRGAGI